MIKQFNFSWIFFVFVISVFVIGLMEFISVGLMLLFVSNFYINLV